MRRWIVAVLMAVLMSLVLGACSGQGSGAGGAPSLTTAPPAHAAVTTPPPAITEPTAPAAHPTPASAVAFVRYFWDLTNYAYTSYQTARLEAVGKPSCDYCASTVADVKRIASGRTRIEGHEVSITDVASPPAEITTGTIVTAISDQAPGRAISASGKAVALQGKRGARFTFSLSWDSGNWHMEGIDYDPKSGTPWDG